MITVLTWLGLWFAVMLEAIIWVGALDEALDDEMPWDADDDF